MRPRPRRSSPIAASWWCDGSASSPRARRSPACSTYLEDPLPSTTLVLAWERSNEPSARSPRIPPTLTKAVTAAGGEIVDTDAPSGRGLGAWVAEQLQAAGLEVDAQARQEITDTLGEDAGCAGGGDRAPQGGVHAGLAARARRRGALPGSLRWRAAVGAHRCDRQRRRAARARQAPAHDGFGGPSPVGHHGHPPEPLHPDAAPRRCRRARREGSRAGARPQGLDLPGQEGHEPGSQARRPWRPPRRGPAGHRRCRSPRCPGLAGRAGDGGPRRSPHPPVAHPR